MTASLLEAIDLQVHFPVGGGSLGRGGSFVRAVDGVSFQVERGKTLGLVGESGSGKSTIGLSFLGLERPTGGQVLFDGRPLDFSRRGLRELRTRRPRWSSRTRTLRSIRAARSVPACVNHWRSTGLHPGRRARERRVGELLDLVGL